MISVSSIKTATAAGEKQMPMINKLIIDQETFDKVQHFVLYCFM